MISFREWSTGKTFPKKNRKSRKNEQSTNQGSAEVGNVYQQREVDRGNQEVVSNDVHYFAEP